MTGPLVGVTSRSGVKMAALRISFFMGMVLLLLAGCGRDREQILIGTWKTSVITAPIMAFKMKEQTPSATGSEAMAAGRLVGATGIELKKDKSFSLVCLGNSFEGTWTFNRESGELSLNVRQAQALPGFGSLPLKSCVAYLDPDNLRLRLYPVEREFVEAAKVSGGPLADGIPLKKDEE